MDRTELRRLLAADRRANAASWKGRIITYLFRWAQYGRSKRGPLGRILNVWTTAIYKLVAEIGFVFELPVTTAVGPGLAIYHGHGVTVNPHAVIGANALLRHGVTIGNRLTDTDCPTIEDDVEFGAGCVVIGAITIGAGSRIGPNTVVATDVPAGSTVFPPIPVIRPMKQIGRRHSS